VRGGRQITFHLANNILKRSDLQHVADVVDMLPWKRAAYDAPCAMRQRQFYV